MLKGLLRLAPCAAVLFLMFSTAQAEDTRHVFTGTLGKMPIVLEVDTSDPEQVTGRYFYEKFHRDLELNGTLKNDVLELKEGSNRFDPDKPLATLNLQQIDGGWRGEWQNPKGKKLPVQVTATPLPDLPPNALPFIATLPKSEPYEYLRLQGLKLKPLKKQDFMGFTLQWWQEPDSKISMFSIESGMSKDDMQRVNRQLLGRLWDETISYYGCQLRGGENTEFLQDVTPTFISPGVISLNISTSYYCGGAHPDFGDSPLNIDVKTGHPLSLEDVLWVGEGEPILHADRYRGGDQPLSAAEEAARSKYQREVFVPWLIKQLTALYPDEMKKPVEGGDDNCDFTNEDNWGASNWRFTEKGLYLGAYFARIERACDSPDWSVLPYSLIKQHPGAVKLQLPQG
ncbi:hypothetical protein [Pseudomonas sp. TWP3-2]|uniref:hypothetical protein n=1 Tax=Pseudomonas sp. TWP3-2 TaxID=2804574 RepID=UPI003CF0AAE0